MEKTIVIERLKQRVRIAVVEEGIPCEYIVEYPQSPATRKEAIYVGRVASVVHATQSAFIDIGIGKNAILHAEKGDKSLLTGSLVTVQIEREPPSPDKGPRVTRNIQLAGRLCVLMPFKPGIGISQKIADITQRTRLHNAAKAACPPGMGVIVRTMAQDESDEALAADIMTLSQRWRALAQKAQGKTKPGCIQQTTDVLDTLLRDLITPDVTRIVCDDAELTACLAEAASDAATRVEHYQGAMPLFDAMQIESRLAKALERKVLLKSGASIVIDFCEAMTVIDVNSGGNVQKRDSEQTALAVNMEAAQEIARQLRLRDIGGIIVVDFIDMKEEAHRTKLLEAFSQALSRDRSRVRLGGISPLGLCEMTRSALRRELREVIHERCHYCDGQGTHRSVREQAYDVLLEVRRRAWAQGNEGQYLLKAPMELIIATQKLREDFPCAALYAQMMPSNKSFTLTQLPLGAETAQYQQIELRSGKE